MAWASFFLLGDGSWQLCYASTWQGKPWVKQTDTQGILRQTIFKKCASLPPPPQWSMASPYNHNTTLHWTDLGVAPAVQSLGLAVQSLALASRAWPSSKTPLFLCELTPKSWSTLQEPLPPGPVWSTIDRVICQFDGRVLDLMENGCHSCCGSCGIAGSGIIKCRTWNSSKFSPWTVNSGSQIP